MHKVLKLIFFFSFYSAPLLLNAQQKYAVLVGVNDYYTARGVKSESSLAGCVNDAKSIKGLLENRFGFSPSNIFTLYNAAATKKKVIDQLQAVFHKSAPGDAVVFYFSGHGVWMTNHNFDDDPVKRGMSQAIVMSDLYSPGWDCLMRDETLKDIFNQFVDKKIILTSIFDCCYSGNIPMSPMLPVYWEGFNEAWSDVRDISIETIPYTNNTGEPRGCPTDPAGKPIDSLDSDSDGVPDCADWEINTHPYTTVNATGVGKDPPSGNGFIALKDNYYDSARFASKDPVPDTAAGTRSFNLKDALTATNKSSVRPSGRKNSRFLNLSGAADNLKGLEIRGVSGRKQGAFTAALLEVYRKNPPGITVTELKKKISTIMGQQSYGQSPKYHHEPSRLNGNLIGIAPQGFLDKTRARCISVKNGFITLDKGWNDGIEKGKILSGINLPGSLVQVVQVYDDSARAVDRSGGKVKPGQMVEMKDPYIVSAPHIKVCIPSALFTPASYESFFNQEIIPQTNEKGYTDYYFEQFQVFNGLVFWEDNKKVHRIPDVGSTQNGGYAFAVLLPVPSYIAESLKSILKKNQNIEIVSDPRGADLVLYLNYVKKRPGVKNGFVFYFHPAIFVSPQGMGSEIFSGQHVMIPSMNISGTKLQSLVKQLHGIAQGSIRGKTTAWINLDDKR